ncbi:MAG: preprotein translocase subunit SecY [Armatimonadota bacterium]
MPTKDTNWKESLNRLGTALQVPDLRKRLMFVAGMFALYVLGLHIPAPFVDPDKIQSLANTGIFGMLDIMSGGAFRRLSILALGIVPYINASIIMQLLGVAVPAVQRLQKEGENGRKIISMWTRIGTVVLAFLQGIGFAIFLKSAGAIKVDNFLGSEQLLGGWLSIVPLVIVMAAGTSFLMWMGEQLTDKGIGNGVSLIIFAGIMIRLPFTMWEIIQLAWTRSESNVAYAVLSIAAIILVFLAIVVFITWVHQATRQIPIQHAKRVVGSRVYSSANTYLPLKVVTAGVIPIIFAISLVMLPGTIANMYQGNLGQGVEPPLWVEVLKIFSPGYGGTLLNVHLGAVTIPFGAILGGLTYFLLVFFFTYFYTAVVYNVQDISDNLKKHGSFIPGLRPGKQTEKFIDQVLTRITFAGALFLGIVALLPYIVPVILRGVASAETSNFPLWGGTSLLIVVGVALETMKQIEAHLVMRHYEGFIKR